MSRMAFSEAEYVVFCNNVAKYTLFLSNAIAEYTKILDDLMNSGIKDEKISGRIYALQNQIALYSKNLDEIEKELKVITNSFANGLELRDKILLPDFELLGIKSLLSVIENEG